MNKERILYRLLILCLVCCCLVVVSCNPDTELVELEVFPEIRSDSNSFPLKKEQGPPIFIPSPRMPEPVIDCYCEIEDSINVSQAL